MTQFPVSSSSEQSIYAALELSKNSWLLAIQVPGRDNPSLYPIRGGDAEGLMAKLDAARKRVAKATGQTPKVTPCYEAGYDGFWLARFSTATLRVEPLARRSENWERQTSELRMRNEQLLSRSARCGEVNKN